MYPTHSLGSVAQWLGINRDDRLAFTATWMSPSRMSQIYAAQHLGRVPTSHARDGVEQLDVRACRRHGVQSQLHPLPDEFIRMPGESIPACQKQFTLLLVDARHIKQVPGRKTDVKDCEWIADLLRHGLLRASFVPDRPHRELRELTRYRTTLVRERAEHSRIQKTLAGAGIKLGDVASNVLGRSGCQMLDALVGGTTDPVLLADMAKGSLGGKRPHWLKSHMRLRTRKTRTCTASSTRWPRVAARSGRSSLLGTASCDFAGYLA
jgi:hypothetical protein